MNKLPDITGVQTLARTRLFHIEQVDLRFSNGATAHFERLASHTAGAVLIIALHDDELLLVREYAVGTERYELSFPKGSIDAGETPESAANRELREEVGYASRDIRLLRRFVMSPAYFNHASHIILARDLHAEPLPGDEPEPLETVRWPLARLWELLECDDFNDGRNHLAVYLLAEHLGMLQR